MRVLVTGAKGFVGRHITTRLTASGYDVRALVRQPPATDPLPKGADLIIADARDKEALADAAQGCQAIIHCAAMVGVEHYARYPVETMEVEIGGLQAVCAAALGEPGCQVVYPSSSAVYGPAVPSTPFTEELNTVGASPYAIAKRFCEQYLEAQHKENGLKYTIFRVFNVYGAGQDHRLVIPRFIDAALSNEPIRIFGRGDHVRDFVYIGDVTEAMEAALIEDNGSHVFNVATATPVTVRTLAETIIRLTGSASKILELPQPEDRRGYEVAWSVGSSDTMYEKLGLRPKVGIEAGLLQTLAGRSHLPPD